MENTTFTYTYSSERNREVESIRKKYVPHEVSKLERLKKLDNKVQSAGIVEALCVGTAGALLFGIGMCFFLDVFSGAKIFAALYMILGVLVMIPAFPIFKYISKKKKASLTPEILRLSDEIINAEKNQD